MVNHLKIKPDEEIVCGMEHHMSDEFTNSLSSILGNPTKSPNGKTIPKIWSMSFLKCYNEKIPVKEYFKKIIPNTVNRIRIATRTDEKWQ